MRSVRFAIFGLTAISGATLASIASRAGMAAELAGKSAFTPIMKAGEGLVGWTSGRSFYSTYWVDAKWALPARALFDTLYVQFGVIQSEDASREAACAVAPWIAGRRYCSRAGEPGPRFTAIYSGVQSELLSWLRAGEPGNFRVYFGGGIARLDSKTLQVLATPYASAEVELDTRTSWSARAAFYLSPSVPGGPGIAAPSFKVEYRF